MYPMVHLNIELYEVGILLAKILLSSNFSNKFIDDIACDSMFKPIIGLNLLEVG